MDNKRESPRQGFHGQQKRKSAPGDPRVIKGTALSRGGPAEKRSIAVVLADKISEKLCRFGEKPKRQSFFYANSEPQPNAKYSCAASVAIAR